MKIKHKFLAIATVATMFSCQDKDGDIINKTPGNFVIAVTPKAETDVADYLLTAASLEEGSISTKGQGVEQDGTYRY